MPRWRPQAHHRQRHLWEHGPTSTPEVGAILLMALRWMLMPLPVVLGCGIEGERWIRLNLPTYELHLEQRDIRAFTQETEGLLSEITKGPKP